MQLVIDIGNTRIKAAVFDQKELKQYDVFLTFDQLLNSSLFQEFPISSAIICTVVNDLEKDIAKLGKKVNVLLFTAQTPVPLQNMYKTAATLGSDRLAGAIGGNTLFPSKNILVVDAGTCIKYNFVNDKNQYLGGAISPGLDMRFKAMNTFTSRLPLLHADPGFGKLIGTSTEESILSGVQTAVVLEVDGMINAYREEYPDLQVLFTGGDVNFFEKRLKNSIFADQFLILRGLNEILIFNAKK